MQGDGQSPNRLRQLRLLLWILVGLAVAGAAILLLMPRGGSSEQAAAGNGLGAPFTLVSADGQPFPSSRLDGKPYAIFFGFTHCPDVCPTTLQRLARLRQAAGGEDAFNIVFVSIDPERDRPAEMRDYAKLFDTPIIALTGSPAQVEQVKKSYGVFAEKAAPASGQHSGHTGYSMNHTSSVLLFDDSGKLMGMIAAADSDEAALQKLKALA